MSETRYAPPKAPIADSEKASLAMQPTISPRLFRMLVLAVPALAILALTLDLLYAPALEDNVIEQLNQTLGAPWSLWSLHTPPKWISWLLAVCLGLVVLIPTIGLYMFKPWARTLWVGTFVLLLCLSPVLGVSQPSVWWAEQLYYLVEVLDVAVITLAYFSDVRHHFVSGERTP